MRRVSDVPPPGGEPREEIFEVSIGESVADICARLQGLDASVSNVSIDKTALFDGRTTIQCIQLQMALCHTNLTRTINGDAALFIPRSESYDDEGLRLLTARQFENGKCTNGRLVDVMIGQGYTESIRKGVCFGVATMAIAAFLADQMPTFIDRVHALSSIDPVYVTNFLYALKESVLAFQAREKDLVATKPASSELAIVRQRFIELRKFNTDMHAFLDGVVLSQNPKAHLDFFTEEVVGSGRTHQNDRPGRDLLEPIDIVSTDLMSEVGKTSDAFRQQDLVKQLDIFASTLVEEKVAGNKFSILLANEKHRMALHFDTDRQVWLFQDPNYLPGSAFDNTETGRAALVAEIYRVSNVEPDGIMFLRSTLLCKADQQLALKQKFVEVKQKLAQYRKQDPSNEAVRALPGKDSSSFIVFAAKVGLMDDDVEKALAGDAEAHNRIFDKGETLLMIAIHHGYAGAVDAVLARGVDVDMADDEGNIALDVALRRGMTDLVKKLMVEGKVSRAVFSDSDCSRLSYAAINNYVDVVEGILARDGEIDIKVDFTDSKNYTALAYALKYQSLTIAEKLLDAGANPNVAIGENGCTGLMFACRHAPVHIVSMLKIAGANLLAVDKDGFTALDYALKADSVDTVKALLVLLAEHSDIQTKGGRTPLMIACERGYLDTIDRLLQAKVTMDSADAKGFTAVDYAMSFQKDNMVLLKKLLLAPMSFNKATTKDGSTALMIACDLGFDDVVDELLARGVDVDMAREDGSTALYRACKYGRVEQVEKLLAAGADMDKAKTDGDPQPTPRAIAERYRRTEIIALLDQAKVLRNRLYDACESGSYEDVCRFITDGDDINKAKPDGKKPFDIACDLGRKDVVNRLLDCRTVSGETVIDVNRVRPDGNTALMVACEQGNLEVAEMLIRAGANIEAPRRGDEYRPFHIACKKGNTALVRLLLSCGADSEAKAKGATGVSIASRFNRSKSKEINLLIRSVSSDARLKPVPPRAGRSTHRSPQVFRATKAVADAPAKVATLSQHVSAGKSLYAPGPGGRPLRGGRKMRVSDKKTASTTVRPTRPPTKR